MHRARHFLSIMLVLTLMQFGVMGRGHAPESAFDSRALSFGATMELISSQHHPSRADHVPDLAFSERGEDENSPKMGQDENPSSHFYGIPEFLFLTSGEQAFQQAVLIEPATPALDDAVVSKASDPLRRPPRA